MHTSELQQIWEKTKGHCHFCGDPVDFDKRGWRDGELAGYWEVDHVIQRDKGGSAHSENCLPACTRCNRLRWHRSGEQVRELLFLGLRSITKRWSMPVHDWKRPKPVRCWFRVKTGCVESVQYFVHGSDAVVKSRWTQFVGCSSLLIPLANYAAPNITRSNRANLVTALGFSANQSATRITFIAQAVSKCCKHVFSNPKYLERRNSNARTPTEMLPSIPALFAYSDLNASVSSRARAATRAS